MRPAALQGNAEGSGAIRVGPVRVGVFGAAGRMGATVCRAVAEDPDLELVAAVDLRVAGADLVGAAAADGTGIVVGASAEEMSRAGAEVAVDFTVARAAMQNLRWCAGNGVHAVVGTTGFSQTDIEELEGLFGSGGAGGANCVMAPNFAIGAVLMMRFAEIAAPLMETAEIVELHHDGKVDAPSGTSIQTAQRMAAAVEGQARRGEDSTEIEAIAGTRGGIGPGGIRIHSVRLPGLVAHQEVVLGNTGQTLTIRHDSYDRRSFMPGALLAIKAVSSRPGLTVGLDSLLGI